MRSGTHRISTFDRLRGPHFSNMDVSVSKYFKLPKKENLHFRLRGEAYNVLNYENFSNPTVNTA
jgi:hypothetical protein